MTLHTRTTLCLLLATGLALAAANARAVLVGPELGVATLQVQDPNGPTERFTRAVPGVALILTLQRGTRLVGDVYRVSGSLRGTTQDIGQQVTATGGHLIIQQQFPVTYSWHPWLGIGAGYAEEHFTSRYTIDTQGYLAQAYPDRSVTPVSLVLDGATDWTLNDHWRLTALVSYEVPLTSGIKSVSFALMALYRL